MDKTKYLGIGQEPRNLNLKNNKIIKKNNVKGIKKEQMTRKLHVV